MGTPYVDAESARAGSTIYIMPDMNSIGSSNSVIHKPIKQRKLFSSDDAATKMIYLPSMAVARCVSRAPRDWISTMTHFAIALEDLVALT
jgi:transposase-like protein